MRLHVGLAVLLVMGCGEAPAERPILEAPPPPLSPLPSIASPPLEPEELVLEASGDLVLNGLAMRAVRAEGDEHAGYHALLDGYGRALDPTALTYVNLEMPLVDDRVELDGGWPRSRTERPRRAPVLGATPVLATVLSELGVELVGVANNHALDQGYGGLAATLAALGDAHLVHAGAGSTLDEAYAARTVEHAGFRVAFLSVTEPLNRRASDGPRLFIARLDPEPILLEAIATARASADVVVVAVHWSTDFVMDVAPSQRHLAERLIAAGADVILGSGPHVLQPIERVPSERGEALVAYSLGNLASGMGRAYRLGETPDSVIHPANVRPEARDGVVLRLMVRRAEDRLEITGEWRLLFTENDWLLQRNAAPPHIVVRPLSEIPIAFCEDRLPPMRRALGSTLPLVPDSCVR